MKILPMLLLNLATVGVALVVYDQVKRDDPAPHVVVESAGTDAVAIERRLQALEAEHRPALTVTGADPRILERLDALEAALGAPSTDDPSGEPALAGRAQGRRDEPFLASEEPTAEDVRRFRALQKAVERDRQLKRNKARVERALGKLSLRLTPRQRAKINEAFTAFQPRVKQIWEEVKTEAQETIAAGGEVDRGEIVSTTTALIQDEFAKSLTDIVSVADAEVVAAAVMPGGR